MITLPSTLTTVDLQHGYRLRGSTHRGQANRATNRGQASSTRACSGSGSLGVRDYTVRLKFGSIPYSDKDAANTTHTIAASEARIDCPTAVPTPTGPPLA